MAKLNFKVGYPAVPKGNINNVMIVLTTVGKTKCYPIVLEDSEGTVYKANWEGVLFEHDGRRVIPITKLQAVPSDTVVVLHRNKELICKLYTYVSSSITSVTLKDHNSADTTLTLDGTFDLALLVGNLNFQVQSKLNNSLL